MAEELFAARPRSHRLQAHVRRQGEAIDNLDTPRVRLEALQTGLGDRHVPCPADWGAVRVTREVIEFWTEGSDRVHDRLSYMTSADGWHCSPLAP